MADEGALVVRVPGLPDFNAYDRRLRARDLGGWYASPAPRAQLVANGGGPGAVAVGPWQPVEKFYTFEGMLSGASRAEVEGLWAQLRAGLPATSEVPLEVRGGATDLQVFVRRYDLPDAEPIGPRKIRFAIPLVAPDPFKYGLEALTASAGAFVAADWFRTYDTTTEPGNPFRVYAVDGGLVYRQYEEDETSTSVLPKVADLNSAGSEDSPRMTITVTGPLTAGEWFINDDVTGNQLRAEVSLRAGQSVVFDCRERIATVDGSQINHLVFGEYLTLSPGTNSFRLIVGSPSEGYMNIEALEAYE